MPQKWRGSWTGRRDLLRAGDAGDADIQFHCARVTSTRNNRIFCDRNTYWIAPLFYRHTTPTDATTVAFPLWWDFKRGNNQTTVFFPVYARWKRPGYQSTYVFPTIYYRKGLQANGDPDGTWLKVVAPFYRSAVYRPGDYMWEVLGGLFGQERIGRKRFLKIIFMRFETEPPTPAQTAWYSKPVRPSRLAPSRGLAASAW